MPEHLSWDFSPDQRLLHELKMSMMLEVGSFAAQRFSILHHIERGQVELMTMILADHLGEEEIVESRREHVEFVGFASWWDHWKATYRGRWWMRWRTWEVNYKVEERDVVATVRVNMTKYWAFPKANIPAPEFGNPVPVITNRVERQWNR